MYTYVKKLRTKPEHVRRQILVVSLGLCMFFVGSIWLYEIQDPYPPQTPQTTYESSVKPFKLFGESITSAYKNMTASVGNVNFSKEDGIPEQKQVNLIPVEYPEGQ